MRLSRRYAIGRAIMVLVVVALVGAAGSGYLLYTGISAPENSASLLLEVSPSLFHAPYYYGIDQGYYKSQDINLTILAGTGTTAAISNVAAGKADFALADTAGLVLALHNSNITNVRVIAMIFESSFFSIIYNKAQISSLSDLQGKTGEGGTSAASTITQVFFLLAKVNHLNISSINMEYGSGSVAQAQLASGKVQFELNSAHNLPLLQAAASENGVSLGEFPFAQNGINIYGEALITNTQTIQNDPDLVQRMVRASMQSVISAIEHPADAIASLVKAQPQVNSTLSLAGWNIDVSCCMRNVTTVSDPLQYGWIDPQRMQQTVNLIVAGLALQPINASSLYTDAFTKPS
jgi:NitT/TauT family transport system substrate-binding protein